MILTDHAILDWGLRLGLALVLPLPLGWDRERRSRSAGLRTYPLLSFCVCGFLLIPEGNGWGPGERADVFYGVLTGIGFAVSGAILSSNDRSGDMSTAASLWVTGAVGAALACASPLLSGALVLISVLALRIPDLQKSGT